MMLDHHWKGRNSRYHVTGDAEDEIMISVEYEVALDEVDPRETPGSGEGPIAGVAGRSPGLPGQVGPYLI